MLAVNLSSVGKGFHTRAAFTRRADFSRPHQCAQAKKRPSLVKGNEGATIRDRTGSAACFFSTEAGYHIRPERNGIPDFALHIMP